MDDGSARRARAHRLTRLLVTSAAVAGATGALAAGPAAAAEIGDGNWARSIAPSLSRHDVRLPKGASNAKLAERAIERSAKQLVRGGELGGLRLVGDLSAARSLRQLRFTQRAGGLRVLWSKLDVSIARGEVQAINATTMPLRGKPRGKVRLTAAGAKAIALNAVAGEDAARIAPELVVYAGSPDRPRAPRRAFVVDVAPANPAAELASDLCVVVDAQSGRVIATWKGFAADRPQRSGKASAAGVQAHAAASVTLIQADDAKGFDAPVSDSRRELTTNDSAYTFGTVNGTQDRNVGFGLSGSGSTPAYGWIADVSRFFCLKRAFCGRDSGRSGPIGGGDYGRLFYTVNWPGPVDPKTNVANSSIVGRYRPDQERIYVSFKAANDPAVIAHEFGHQIDTRFMRDYIDTKEGQEVREAIGDMFGLDWEQGKVRSGVTHPTQLEATAFPTRFGSPVDYNSYSCTNPNVHGNAPILADAYRRIGIRIGWEKAGQLLVNVPAALPAMRTFSSVRTTFKSLSDAMFGSNSAESAAVTLSFQEEHVGLTTATRSTKCPGQVL